MPVPETWWPNFNTDGAPAAAARYGKLFDSCKDEWIKTIVMLHVFTYTIAVRD